MPFVNQSGQRNYAGNTPMQQPQQPVYGQQQGYNGYYQQPQANNIARNKARAMTLMNVALNNAVNSGRLNPAMANTIGANLQRDAYSNVWDNDLSMRYGQKLCSDSELNVWISNQIAAYENKFARAGYQTRGMVQQPMYGQQQMYPQQGFIQPQPAYTGYPPQQPMMQPQPGFIQPQQPMYGQQQMYPQQGFIQPQPAYTGYPPQQPMMQPQPGFIQPQQQMYQQGYVQPGMQQRIVTPQSQDMDDSRYIYSGQAAQNSSTTFSPYQQPTMNNPTYSSRPAVTTAAPLKQSEVAQPKPQPQPAPVRTYAKPGDSWEPKVPSTDYSKSKELIEKLFGENNEDNWVHATRVCFMKIQHKPATPVEQPAESEVDSADIRIDVPVESIEQAIADVTVNHKEAITVPAVHNITMKMQHVIHLPFDLAKKDHENIQYIINGEIGDVNKTDPERALKDIMGLSRSVLRGIRSSSNSYKAAITDLILDLFNRQFVNCVGYKKPDNTRVTPKALTTLEELDAALDLENPMFEDFKNYSQPDYCRAINQCLRASIFSIWSTEVKNPDLYLNPETPENLQLILSNSVTGLAIDGVPVRLIRTIDMSSEEMKKKVMIAAKSVFIITYDKTIVLSNLDLGIYGQVKGTNDFGTKVLDPRSPYAAPLQLTVGRRMFADVVLMRDKSTLQTPYIASTDMDGRFTLRKALSHTRQNCQ
jgi:hypothetical protein